MNVQLHCHFPHPGGDENNDVYSVSENQIVLSADDEHEYSPHDSEAVDTTSSKRANKRKPEDDGQETLSLPDADPGIAQVSDFFPCYIIKLVLHVL